MENSNDPRVYFASERTLLAWIRTGLAVVGLGFVVARFGLFLQVIHNNPHAKAYLGSTLIGVGLILLGSVVIGMAAYQHVRFCRSLSSAERPQPYLIQWSVWVAGIFSMIGATLAVYLLIRSGTS